MTSIHVCVCIKFEFKFEFECTESHVSVCTQPWGLSNWLVQLRSSVSACDYISNGIIVESDSMSKCFTAYVCFLISFRYHLLGTTNGSIFGNDEICVVKITHFKFFVPLKFCSRFLPVKSSRRTNFSPLMCILLIGPGLSAIVQRLSAECANRFVCR